MTLQVNTVYWYPLISSYSVLFALCPYCFVLWFCLSHGKSLSIVQLFTKIFVFTFTSCIQTPVLFLAGIGHYNSGAHWTYVHMLLWCSLKHFLFCPPPPIFYQPQHPPPPPFSGADTEHIPSTINGEAKCIYAVAMFAQTFSILPSPIFYPLPPPLPPPLCSCAWWGTSSSTLFHHLKPRGWTVVL